MLPDFNERQTALDTSQSLIVQAPAGSGKTSLLTQRFLALLTTVESPEQIIAITFTKKAAKEMRTRIIETLAMSLEPPPEETYLKQSYTLSLKAMACNEKYHWDLLNNPQRLRIQTIDSLCHYLTRLMPLLSSAIPYSQLGENCEQDYQEAAVSCLKTALKHPHYQEAAITIIQHLGNHQNRLIELFQSMLLKRDQWLKTVLSLNNISMDYFVEGITYLQRLCVDNINNHISAHLLQNLIEIWHYRLSFVPIDDHDFHIDGDNFNFWQQTALLLLTTDNKPRSRFTKTQGFPAKTSFKNKDEKDKADKIKALLKDITDELSENELLIKELVNAKMTPLKYIETKQWHVLQALLKLLPLLAAELRIIFANKNKVDFSEVAMQANLALGDECPTDLNLFIDYQIKHLLIDEFQDTSLNQFELVEKLIRGWQQGDGRTLFIVGDPMQSIYRFRQAEVSLFLRAQQHGIADIPLKALYLKCNFRSAKGIVNWVNQSCQYFFPKESHAFFGAIDYKPSVATKESPSAIQAYMSHDKNDEALMIADIIKQNPNKTIAILVQSRKELNTIVPTFAELSIDAEGVDLIKLTNISVIDTLCHIVKALHNPLDNIAWFSLMTSPLCGIDYQCMEYIANTIKHSPPQSFLTHIKDCPAIFSAETKKRLYKLLSTLAYFGQRRYQVPLEENVKACWQQLNGPLTIADSDNENLDLFWLLLDKQTSFPLDINALMSSINHLYSSNTSQSPVQIMTIHKAKGLEFDIVILPSLESNKKPQDTALINWLQIPHPTKGSQLLLSPISDIHDNADNTYHFISHIDKEKEFYEMQRLLYVAMTRAKEKLYLLANEDAISSPPSKSFLAMLSPFLDFSKYDIEKEKTEQKTLFERLKANYFEASEEKPATIGLYHPKSKTIVRDSQRLIGIYLHELLYYIAEAHIDNYDALSHFDMQSRLLEMGIEIDELEESIEFCQLFLQSFFNSEKGQWIIRPHQDENNELALNTSAGCFIIDRTFIENNIRWIVDYKSGSPMDKPKEEYIEQLEQYGKLFSQKENLPIKLALFYPLTDTFYQWDYIPIIEKSMS